MWTWTYNIFLLFLCGLIHNGYGLSRVDPLVESKAGLIKGLKASDGDYSMFLGIPYATVDENNPFGSAQQHPGFNEAFTAYDDSAKCPQAGDDDTTLDCLQLSVYVPNTASSGNPLPVMVWIHGGGFSFGSFDRSLYGPKFLVKQNVILVTLNYRLGPYGFMCLDTPDVPGNQGLKDQQLALKWVKNNIEAFGGNPHKITIFGESAGGASVDFHINYSKEKIFNQVIMQSGNSMAHWAIVEKNTNAPLEIANSLGLSTTDINDALRLLSSIDPKLVIAASLKLGLSFWPCVEQEFENVDRFIYDYPANIQKPNLGNIRVLLGYNSDECLVDFETMSSEDIENSNQFEENLRNSFNFNDEYFDDMVSVLRHFYIGDEKISIDVKQGLTRFCSDFLFNYPTVRSIQKYLSSGVKDIYYYVFFYESERNFFKNNANVTAAGVSHADELYFFFDGSFMKEPTPEDQLTIDRVTTLWANFAKFGNPTPAITELLPVTWPAVTKDFLNCLYIDSELKADRRNYKGRLAFWDLFYKLNAKYQVGYKNDN